MGSLLLMGAFQFMQDNEPTVTTTIFGAKSTAPIQTGSDPGQGEVSPPQKIVILE